MQRRPIFQFDTDLSTGLGTLPVGTIITVVNYASTGARQFQVLNTTGLTALSTVAQALASGNIQAEATQTALSAKQDTLIAGTNITIAADGKTISANNYVLPNATASVLGGVKASVSGTTLTLTF